VVHLRRRTVSRERERERTDSFLTFGPCDENVAGDSGVQGDACTDTYHPCWNSLQSLNSVQRSLHSWSCSANHRRLRSGSADLRARARSQNTRILISSLPPPLPCFLSSFLSFFLSFFLQQIDLSNRPKLGERETWKQQDLKLVCYFFSQECKAPHSPKEGQKTNPKKKERKKEKNVFSSPQNSNNKQQQQRKQDSRPGTPPRSNPKIERKSSSK